MDFKSFLVSCVYACILNAFLMPVEGIGQTDTLEMGVKNGGDHHLGAGKQTWILYALNT